MNEREFQSVVNIAKSIACSSEEISRLRRKYSEKISSKRIEERISSTTELINTLQKRDELNMDVVCDIISDLRPAYLDVNNLNRIPTVDHRLPSPVFRARSAVLHDRIFQIISEDIGHKWKELARALYVKEGQIDDLELRLRSISDRVLEVLKYHHEVCDRQMWRTELLEALSQARRNDLRKKISRELDRRC